MKDRVVKTDCVQSLYHNHYLSRWDGWSAHWSPRLSDALHFTEEEAAKVAAKWPTMAKTVRVVQRTSYVVESGGRYARCADHTKGYMPRDTRATDAHRFTLAAAREWIAKRAEYSGARAVTYNVLRVCG